MLRTISTAFTATASAAILLTAVSFGAQAKESGLVAAFGQDQQTTEETSSAVTGSFEDAAVEAEAAQQTFTLINTSNLDIYYVFVSPETSDTWGEDFLGEDILPAGYEIDLAVEGETDQCVYDIQVVSAQGDSLEFWGVDLCNVSEVEVQ